MLRCRFLPLVFIGSIALAGCAERVYIRSIPTGATLTVNGTYVGVTPVVAKVPRSELTEKPVEYRLEREGYAPTTGQIPVVVSTGRIVGAVFTVGILTIFKGVHTFGEGEMTIGMLPAGTMTATGATQPLPHERKIFITSAPLQSLPAGSYVFIKEIALDRKWYGGYGGLLNEMATDARNAGADAVFELEKHMRVGAFAWATPRIRGRAIALTDPCALRGIAGEIYPAEEADTPQNQPISARCTEKVGQRKVNGGATAGTGGCTLEQVLSMKNAGLTDEQIKAACAK